MYIHDTTGLLVILLALVFSANGWLPPTRLRAPQNPWRTPLLIQHAKKKNRQEDTQSEDEENRTSMSNENGNKNGGSAITGGSTDEAISARSTPANTSRKKEKHADGKSKGNQKRTAMKRSKKRGSSNNSSLLSLPNSRTSSKANERQSSKNESSFSSLLPPPLPNSKAQESDSLKSGLSSWEEFLGRAELTAETKRNRSGPQSENFTPYKKSTKQKGIDVNLDLPSISDLFPPDLTSKKEPTNIKQSQSLDGVLPVSELFYRSSQAITGEEKEESRANEMMGDEGDDEELPFSAEQTDELTTDGNKVRIRQNRAAGVSTDNDTTRKGVKRRNKAIKRNRGRKLVRRGMEMFLGGAPINADPPQRSLELSYQVPNENNPYSWATAISLNTNDFGPLLHNGSAESISPLELGLYCENFVSAALKWDVCPKDLRDLVKSYTLQQESPSESKLKVKEEVESQTATGTSSINVKYTNGNVDSDKPATKASLVYDSKENDGDSNILSLLRNIDESGSDVEKSITSNKGKNRNVRSSPAKGFGKKPEKSRSSQKNTEQKREMVGFALKFSALQFSIGVSKEELESGDSRDAAGSVMRSVLTRGITAVLRTKKLHGLVVKIHTLKLQEADDGATTVKLELRLNGKGKFSQHQIEKLAAQVDAALRQAMDDGDFALALAAAANEEAAWPQAVRDRVVEEFLLEDDDVYTPWEEAESQGVNRSHAADSTGSASDENGIPNTSTDSKYPEDSIFEKSGVFFDYSESNAANAPFKGELGPILLEAVTARSAERPPHIIAIGDVHGCIDELQDLLRLCDYRPGDQIVFLGDLVSKGPDSISVVQMAREIGAIGVRGNHDFEVIRWHQAIKAGKYRTSCTMSDLLK